MKIKVISNSNGTEWSTIQGVIGHDYSLNCTIRFENFDIVMIIIVISSKLRDFWETFLNFLVGSCQTQEKLISNSQHQRYNIHVQCSVKLVAP